MHFPLTPIVAALLAAALPTFPAAVSATTLGPVVVDDAQGSTSLVLAPGSTITAATGDAISVTGLGNSVAGNEIQVIGQGASGGVVVQDGGAVSLNGSTVFTQTGTAVSASHANSVVSTVNTQISSAGVAVSATDSGRVALEGQGVVGLGQAQAELLATNGGVITAKDLGINSADALAVQAQTGGRIELTNTTISSGTPAMQLPMAIMLDAAELVMHGSHVLTESARGVGMVGGSVATINGSSIAGGIALREGSTLNMSGSAIAPSSAITLALSVDGPETAAVLDDVSIGSKAAPAGYAIRVQAGGSLTARDLHVEALRYAVESLGGTVTLEGGTLRGQLAGLQAWGSSSIADPATIEAVGTHILADTSLAVGAFAGRPDAYVFLNDVTVDVTDEAKVALRVADGARLDAVNSRLNSHAIGSAGLQVQGGAGFESTHASLSNTQVNMSAQSANGVESVRYAPQDTNSIVLSHGSHLQTEDGVGFLLMGGHHDIAVEHSTVLTRTEGNDATGVLLKTQTAPAQEFLSIPPTETERVSLNAVGAFMTGDVLAGSGYIDIDLKQGSVLNGAVNPDVAGSGGGSIKSLSTDGGSVWNVRGNSAVQTLSNAGTVRFMAPDAQGGFKTLTVADYVGGGTLVMNTRLGDDTSLTDKLVIDGGTVSGATHLHVVNAGGTGALTTQGIRLVQAINGATTATDAFLLGAGSSGYRATSGTLGLNGYEYFLVQGGQGGVASDWYLTSAVLPPEVEPPPGAGVDPSLPGSGVDPVPPGSGVVVPQPPGGGGESGAHPPGTLQNISPESGVSIGNQVAATRMFVHRLSDRTTAPTVTGLASLDGSAERIWMRTEGLRHTGLRMTQGAVGIDTDTATLQIGADLIRTRAGQQGALMAGVMGGYGDARVRSTSRLTRPDSGATVGVDARGKVSGYALGIYATAYANDRTRLGAYADSWLQFGRYANEIHSDLGAARYRSKAWSASLETGYAFQPFAADSALGAMVVVPQVQVIYTRYDARDAELPSMTLQTAGEPSVSTRIGVRAYPLGNAVAAASLRPFIEANWLHGNGGPRANTESASFSSAAQSAAELKIGVVGNVGDSLHVTGEFFGQAGRSDQRGYGGMLKLGYRW